MGACQRSASPRPYCIDTLFVYTEYIHMIDLDQIAGFDWDDGNHRKSADKHDVSQAETESVFFNDPLIVVECQA